jgi:hypothetical protein
MSDQMDPLKFAAIICDLERQMTELLALRRAICLLNAERSRPLGPRYPRRRRTSISSMQSAESVARCCYRESDRGRVARLPPTKHGDSSGGVRSSQALQAGHGMPGRRGTTEDEMEFP